MSRPLKFRAWDKKNNTMWSFEEITGHNYEWNDIIKSYIVKPLKTEQLAKRRFPWEKGSILGQCFYPDPWLEVMQFTGLHDKNGREIWEGDVVLDNGYRGTITYIGPRFFLDSMPFGGPSQGLKLVHERCEVLGNVHEHPELLNGILKTGGEV